MLAKIAPRFVISRVIQNSYLAENQAVSLLKKRFEDRDEYFATMDAESYQAVRFFGYISTLSKPYGFKNKYEERAYDQACQRFKTFNETLEIYDRLQELHKEAFMIYNYLELNVAASNLFTQRIDTDKDFGADVVESVQKYNKLEDALEPYPEWLEKVQQQIGGLYHLIYNHLSESDAKTKVFSKLRRQQHFL